ncbi:hypothetical protein [Atlantibacter hermannii]|uniref:hypothetical protein n=1 Tax=Atlantibacter hermannii TaxID=565 RepID=UPI00289C162F|nr:hypothetical protein [Atlantibacter hermannii]
MEESRKQFEHECRNGLINGGLARHDNGSYVSELTHAVWRGWQASRAAIEIELPSKQPCSQYEHYMPQFTMDADMVENAIRAAGLTVKGDR